MDSLKGSPGHPGVFGQHLDSTKLSAMVEHLGSSQFSPRVSMCQRLGQGHLCHLSQGRKGPTSPTNGWSVAWLCGLCALGVAMLGLLAFPPILFQQSSESVTLDLLTYTDLESLRNRKMGGRPGPLASRSAQLNSKRYLILIYSVEFDRWG